MQYILSVIILGAFPKLFVSDPVFNQCIYYVFLMSKFFFILLQVLKIGRIELFSVVSQILLFYLVYIIITHKYYMCCFLLPVVLARAN